MSANLPPKQTLKTGWKRPAIVWTAQWVVLFGLWTALSGKLEREFLLLGALTAAAGVWFSHRQFHETHEGRYAPAPSHPAWLLRTSAKFILYLPWFILEVVLANLHVAYLVLHPKLPIDPMLVEFDTSLKSEVAQVLLAQSITLTPGTVTVDATDGRFLVHCLSRRSREGLASGDLQTKVGQLFEEPARGAIELRDVTTLGGHA
ncbi:MAG: Na+/H+ antiporter subunit E [Dehalococcoidia bacterium]